jgi:hypothetical protein
MRSFAIVSCLFLLSSTVSAATRDVYVLQGIADGVAIGLESAVWNTDALFFNRGDVDAQVTLLGISNGVPPDGRVGESFTVAAGRNASIQQSTRWIPAAPFVMLHLSVPEQIVVQNVLYVGSRLNVGASIPCDCRKFGKVTLPSPTALVPAGEQQIHLETDIGNLDGHLNVAIYNAGVQPATAVIETRAHYNDGVVSHETVSVPADTVLQFGPFQTATGMCCGNLKNSLYTVVTVDQPSLTFVSALANGGFPTTSISIADP